MPDIIYLLPDSVANQIAAGEVIQRPSSAVKELLENAVDSGTDEIKLVIKDAGKTLIQVIDNGCGMSETDARMSFERHATSKIKTANDLFAIKTLGFRGEALASIAAIAQIELRTKRVEDELGTQIVIEGSLVKSQEPCACADGTSLSIKNLFFNIPARRKFLKADTTELRHIIEEFERVALVNPGIKFSFFNGNQQLYMLSKSNLKQRIVSLLGTAYNNRLLPVEIDSNIVNISGYIGKAEFAKKTRGDQFFFVNGRFIKHPYLNHAVDNAFRELIPSDSFPSYFLYITIDPKEIDINIHPTKTEVNFQNGQVIYSMISSAVKQGLGKFSVAQTIDFNVEPTVQFKIPGKEAEVIPPTIKVDPDYNPFENQKLKNSFSQTGNRHQQNATGWEKLFENDYKPVVSLQPEGKTLPGQQETLINQEAEDKALPENIFQLQNKYIISVVKSGLMILHQQRAFERIYFEEFMSSMETGRGMSQQLLFPATFQVPAGDAEIVKSIFAELKILGFDLEGFGENTFIIHGLPSSLNNHDVNDVLEDIIENFKKNQKELVADKRINLARSMAINMAAGMNNKLQTEEMIAVIDRLFLCKVPNVSPVGKPVVKIIMLSEIEEMFK
jgi:DNA mismatch repair protein MutL